MIPPAVTVSGNAPSGDVTYGVTLSAQDVPSNPARVINSLVV